MVRKISLKKRSKRKLKGGSHTQGTWNSEQQRFNNPMYLPNTVESQKRIRFNELDKIGKIMKSSFHLALTSMAHRNMVFLSPRSTQTVMRAKKKFHYEFALSKLTT
jgi:hypothetical protein